MEIFDPTFFTFGYPFLTGLAQSNKGSTLRMIKCPAKARQISLFKTFLSEGGDALIQLPESIRL